MTFTPDEIIAMAKEAGIHIDRLPDEYCTAVNLPLGSVSRWDGVGLGELQRFAALVAAKAASRATEAFAVLALDKAGTTDYDYSTCINIADAIRARGTKEGA